MGSSNFSDGQGTNVSDDRRDMWTEDERRQAGKDFDLWISESWDEAAARAARRRMAVATDLGIAVAESQQSRKAIADRAGMKAALLSKQLSGGANLTLDSIGRICEAAGYDFDIVLRYPGEPAAKQPWDRKLDRAQVYRLFSNPHPVKRAPAVWLSSFAQSDKAAANHEFELVENVA